jgi:hypothetical protein
MHPLLPLLPLQLVHEFRLLLLLGRTLCHRQPGFSITCTRLVQHRAADGSISERQVDLMFPATERTVLRLMQAWWDRKVGANRGLQDGCNCKQRLPWASCKPALLTFQAGSPGGSCKPALL